MVTTSDVYFQESLFPSRPRGQQTDDSAPEPPTRPTPDVAQPPGVPPAGAVPSPATDSDALSDADTVEEEEGEARRASRRTGSVGWARRAAAYSAAISRSLDDAARSIRGLTTPLPRRVLILFSGPYARPDGLAAFLRAKGIDVDQYDCDEKKGGGEDANILNDAFFTSLFNLVRNGHYAAVFTAPPCSTYSVARHFPANRPGRDKGPPVVRKRGEEILGVKDVPAGHQRELRRANEITRRTAVLLTAAHRAGAQFVLENPADRGDKENLLLYQVAEHGPIWHDPHVRALQGACGAESVTFAQCMFGADVQKYTTLLFTPGLAPMLRPLHQMVCSHTPGTHTMAGGAQREDGTWNSAPAAAYPADFNLFMCDAITSYILGSDASAPAAATVPATIVDPGDASPPPQSGLGAEVQPTAPTAPGRHIAPSRAAPAARGSAAAASVSRSPAITRLPVSDTPTAPRSRPRGGALSAHPRQPPRFATPSWHSKPGARCRR